MIKQYILKATAAAVACVSALALFSGCGNTSSGSDPWDYSKPIPAAELISYDPSEKLFTGLEWTGKTYSKDINGNTVNQSDIVRVNALDYHSVGTVVYDSVEKAVEGSRSYNRTVSKYYKLLTGKGNAWQLAVYKNEEDAEAAGVTDFYKTDYDMSKAPVYDGEQKIYTSQTAYYGGFKEVTLPASWQTQGFDFPIYTNTIYPWNDGAYGNERVFAPVIPTKTNPVGFYRCEFDVDEDWISSGRRVYISFGGVESAYYVYVNGYEVGYSEDTFDAADYDITPYLNKDGKKNLLAVKVHRWCDGSYYENQDFMRLAGIFRDVYLYSTTGVRIKDYTVVTDLDKNFKDAELKISLDVDNTTAASVSDMNINVRLFDADGKEVIGGINKSVPATASGEISSVSLSKKVAEPRLWSDEDPYLYTLVISLYSDDGVYYGSIAQQLGFRELTFTPTADTSKENEHYDTVLLNGKVFKFRGVDRHEANPNTGRYLTLEEEERDILIMKQNNINAVRTSHYPDDENFYNMCDKYGILVMGECNIETHYNVNGDDTETYFSKLITDRIKAHTTAYKNRTCILMWSMGNETVGGTKTFLENITALKQRDPTRPVHFESQGSGGGVDVASTMYSDISGMEWRGGWENHMPYLQCEYAHAMGNSVGNLYEYWQPIRKFDNILGAFIWDYVDQGIWTEIPNGKYDYYGNGKYIAYGGCWGDNPNSGDFCQNGIISADRTVQPEMQEVKYVYQSIWFDNHKPLSATNRTIEISSEYRFTDLSEYAFTYELLRNGVAIDSGTLDVSCAPLSKVEIEVPYNLPAESKPNSEYLLTVYASLKDDESWAKAGHVVALQQFDIKGDYNNQDADISAMPDVSVSENGDDVIITGSSFEVVFSKSKGIFTSYTYSGEAVIEKGPEINFNRARISNDNVWNTPDTAKVKTVESFAYELSPDKKYVTITVKLLLTAGTSTEEVTYTVYGGGEIKVSRSLKLSKDVEEMLKYGNVITLPMDYENMTYYGCGPADTYNDRKRGAPAMVYTQTVSESFYPYGKPQDTGTKTDVRYIALTSDEKNTGILISADGMVQASAIHYTAQGIGNARYTYGLPAVKNTYLNVDFGSRGTGGASCGPETLHKYKLLNDTTKYEYSYTIIPFDKNTADLDTIAGEWRIEE